MPGPQTSSVGLQAIAAISRCAATSKPAICYGGQGASCLVVSRRLGAPLWLESKFAESFAQVDLPAPLLVILWLLGFLSRNLLVPVPTLGTQANKGCPLKIYVGNLNPTTDDAQLRQAFASHGEVSSAVVIRDRDTQTSRGFGFIEMPGTPEAQAAMAALNGSTLDGNLLVVNEARPRETGSRDFRGGSSRR